LIIDHYQSGGLNQKDGQTRSKDLFDFDELSSQISVDALLTIFMAFSLSLLKHV